MTTASLPVIDLGGARGTPSVQVVSQVADAAENFGFFQIVNHGIGDRHLERLWAATRTFFEQPAEAKRQIERTKENSRGYYDRELTKNARDLKEVLDIAHVPFPELADDDPRNFHRVDGQNQWPRLDDFRDAVIDYLRACNDLSLWLLQAFCRGLGDAGALTLLLQDDVGGLQVAHGGTWIDVEPLAGAIVVNTGDMMQVWSNDRYTAALHRVAPRTINERYSLPYFFNPSYSTSYQPLPGSIGPGDYARYRSISWGDFRQARADGDFADYGAEVQISDFVV
jgi:isopenicillin N synthase-like dioxygenase